MKGEIVILLFVLFATSCVEERSLLSLSSQEKKEAPNKVIIVPFESSDSLFVGKELSTYENAKSIDGVYIYIQNWVKKIEVSYSDGKRNGPVMTYHDNGQLESKGYYVRGEKKGFYLQYDTDGEVTKIDFYN